MIRHNCERLLQTEDLLRCFSHAANTRKHRFLSVSTTDLSSKRYMMKTLVLSVALPLLVITAQAGCDELIFNGAKVTDKRTGLTWRRCVEGKKWDSHEGICTGQFLELTHEQALAVAKAANPTDSPTGWRLPNVKELASLNDISCGEEKIRYFPLSGTYFKAWTSTPAVRKKSSNEVWVVTFGWGRIAAPVGTVERDVADEMTVLLVRSTQ